MQSERGDVSFYARRVESPNEKKTNIDSQLFPAPAAITVGGPFIDKNYYSFCFNYIRNKIIHQNLLTTVCRVAHVRPRGKQMNVSSLLHLHFSNVVARPSNARKRLGNSQSCLWLSAHQRLSFRFHIATKQDVAHQQSPKCCCCRTPDSDVHSR